MATEFGREKYLSLILGSPERLSMELLGRLWAREKIPPVDGKFVENRYEDSCF